MNILVCVKRVPITGGTSLGRPIVAAPRGTGNTATWPSNRVPTTTMRPGIADGVKLALMPSIAASASMPPTPQPSTPRPLIIVVCESVPTSVSGYSTPSFSNTTRARYSRLTWWTIPVSGGTALKPSNAVWPQRRKA